MDEPLTRRARLSTMLIVAAMVLPVLSTIAAMVMRHFFLVHYTPRSLELWLLLDAAVLAAGLIVRENDGIAAQTSRRRKR